MASIVLDVLRTTEPLSFEVVADAVLARLGDDPRQVTDDRTLRRRVYDVLNVFMAAGIVLKEGRSLMWTGLPARPSGGRSGPSSLRTAVRMHEIALIDKITIYIAWRLVLNRNRTRPRPAIAVSVHRTIFIGFRTSVGGCDESFDGRKIELHANAPAQFFSPMEAIANMGFTRDQKKAVLLTVPKLRDAVPIMFPEGDEEPED
jgi:hypothetical protein